MISADQIPKLINHHTWGYLNEKAPFAHLFPHGVVPLKSVFLVTPDVGQAPPCYVIKGDQLDDHTVNNLVALCRKLAVNVKSMTDEELEESIRSGFPVKAEYIDTVGTNDAGMIEAAMLSTGVAMNDPATWMNFHQPELN